MIPFYDEALEIKLAELFENGYKVYSVRGETIVRGRLNRFLDSPATELARLDEDLRAVHYMEDIEGVRYLTLTIPAPGKRKPSSWKLNLILFVLTVVTTLFAGAMLSGVDVVHQPSRFWVGFPFSATIMAVLGLHELGHYLSARKYKLNVTLPYFIPVPTIIGTLGAVIRMKSPIHHRRMLLDIGAAGPITGFLVSIPITFIGLLYSHHLPQDVSMEGSSIQLGSSLIFGMLSRLALGTPADGSSLVHLISTRQDMVPYFTVVAGNIGLHPVAFAGWVGLYITSINLLPIGQLDGGHILYSLFGRRQEKISTFIFALLIVLGVIVFLETSWPGWFLWVFFIFFLAKIPHPPVVDESVPLGKTRYIIGISTLIIFLLTFIPDPVRA
jgi:membrane-associated protease RseP (regulator of RpoE activity)